jgi:hypothetical protein
MARPVLLLLVSGLIYFVVVFCSGFALGIVRVLWLVPLNRDPVAGAAYYVALCAFAVMPWLLGRHERSTN